MPADETSGQSMTGLLALVAAVSAMWAGYLLSEGDIPGAVATVMFCVIVVITAAAQG